MIAVKLLFKNSFKDFITFYHNCQFFVFIFLKELEVIVNTYEDIYNDNEVQKMFEDFKENF